MWQQLMGAVKATKKSIFEPLKKKKMTMTSVTKSVHPSCSLIELLFKKITTT